VARLLLRGIERGQYHLPSADLGQNLLVSGMTSLRWELLLACCIMSHAAVCLTCTCCVIRRDIPHAHTLGPTAVCFLLAPDVLCSPKRYPLLVHVLLGPILPLVTSLFGWLADSAAAKHNKLHGMPPRRQEAAGDVR
jgi:hypothetical protein